MSFAPVSLAPALAVVVAGGLWGLLWWPMRALENSALPGDWLTFLLFLFPTLLLSLAVAWRRKLPPRLFMAALLTGLFAGAGSMLYALSLVMTTVAKALLLFYLTPVWSTIMEYLLLGVRIRGSRVFALLLGILGLMVVLHEDGVPMPSNPGDWIALLSGIAWAYGTVRVHSQQNIPLCESIFAYFAGASVVALAVIALPLEAFGNIPVTEEILHRLPALLAIGAIMIGAMILVYWSTLRLSPATVGLLLMFEVIIGIGSAYLLTDEAFGLRELIGASLIMSAAVLEVMRQQEGDPA